MALLLLMVVADGAYAQWKMVAPKLVGGIGAIHVKNGIVWVGSNTLWSSSDTGKTWQKSLPDIGIYDINFFDNNVGVISTDGILLTQDGGQTWTNILTSQAIDNIAFGSTDSIIYGLVDNGDELEITTDMGNTWQTMFFGGSEGRGMTVAKDGTIYVFSIQPIVGGNGWTGWLNSSSNQGKTWSPNVGSIDGDSFTIISDSCSASSFYLAHEGEVRSLDNLSHIFATTDAGVTWQADFTNNLGVVSGNITAGTQAIYAGAYDSKGVLRSLDRGLSWTRIGGPRINWDTHDIAALNNNIVFALDSIGDVWVTYNSGGDSVQLSRVANSTLSVSPVSLFEIDTISCNSITHSVFFNRSGCPTLSVSGWSVIGADSANFSAGNLSYDSIEVTLHGTKSGNQQAQLILFIDNGSEDIVSLAGYVNIMPNALTLATQDAHTDTLGGNVAIPITINGLTRNENVELILRYDGTVDYLGSFSPSGLQLDVPGDQSAGRSLIQIAGAAPGVVAGYAKFNVFDDSNENAHASFDLVSVLTAVSPCEYSLPQPVSSTISTVSGCGADILSQTIHLGALPQFSVNPNPANGNVSISSSQGIGDVTITVCDMLGTRQSVISGKMNENNPVELLLPGRSGVYNIMIRSAAGTQTLRIVQEHQ